MKMIRRPLVIVAAAMIAGILCSVKLHLSFGAAAALFTAAALLFWLYASSETSFAKALLLFFCAGFFFTGFLSAGAKTAMYQAMNFPEYCDLVISGTVDKTETHGNRQYVYLTKVLLSENSSVAETADGSRQQNKALKADAFLLLLPKEAYGDTTLLPGNKIRTEAQFLPLSQARNRGNFDEKAYYHSLGIAGKAKAETLQVTHAGYAVLKRQLVQLKNALIWSLTAAAGSKQAAVFLALAAGDRTQLSTETRTLFQESGIAHILAISGLHISLIGLAVFHLLRKRLPFVPAAFAAVFTLLLFCLFSGSQISAQRAVVMFAIALAATGFGKSYDQLNALALTAIVLLLENPCFLLNTGFLLSFLAVVSIATLGKSLQKLTASKQKILSTLLVSLSITLFTSPVIANLYFQIPVYALLLNLLVIPLLSFVLGSGLMSGFLGILSLPLGRFFIGFGLGFLLAIESAAEILLRFPGSIVTTGHLSAPRLFLYYSLLCSAYVFCRILQKKERAEKRKPSRSLFVAAFFAAALAVLFVKPHSDTLCLSFLDVDQGESILLTNPNGTTYLIDAGSTGMKEVWKYRIASAVKYLGVSAIDYVILTHPDADHINGMIEALQATNRGQIAIRHLLIPYVEDSEAEERLRELAGRRGIAFSYLHAGMAFHDGSLQMTCLYPQAGFVSSDTNAYSAVLDLSYQGFHALFTGDLDAAGEQYLCGSGLLSHCDLLKVAHHGSRFSSQIEFLETVHPSYAVISAGAHNSYGHPHAETLARLQAVGARVFQTGTQGEITFHIRKGKVEVSTVF